jgi:diaminobutyrate-2-oxoglutarate transaminase
MDVFDELESEVRAYCRSYPVVFESAKNAKQTDEGGRTYIDFFAGAGVLNFGHNHDRIKQALIKFLQDDGIAHSLDMATTVKRAFMEKFNDTILKPLGMKYRMQFTGPTGSNAVEASLKLARKITGRHDVVAFTNGFHGMTLGALACTGNGVHRGAAGVPLPHTIRASYDGYVPGDTLAALEKALEDGSSGIKPPAAFMVEVIQAEGGVNVATAEWLRRVQDLAKKHGALFIIDDIQVGCGRTGTYFSFEGMGLDPDVIVLAKGIGGYGTPLAMCLIKPERDKWAPGEHTGTFRGPGLSFVAGAEALAFFEDPAFLESVKKMGKTMWDRMTALRAKHSVIKDVRGRGMIVGVDVGTDAAKRITKECFDRGMIISPCGPLLNVMKLIPPLTIEPDVLDEGLTIFEAAVAAAEAGIQ